MTPRRSLLWALLAVGCHTGKPTPPSSAGKVADFDTGPLPGGAVVPAPRPPPATYQGAAIARAATNDALYVADEDHTALRRIPLPIYDDALLMEETVLPGRPAQVVALADRVLVTIRDPGLLLVLAPGRDGKMAEQARVALPADAWGIAITTDEQLAVVSSAWTHQITGIDLGTLQIRFTLDVGREPRGIAIAKSGTVAYVSHLVGAPITRIDDLRGNAVATSVDLPPASLRAPEGVSLGASLGYAALLSDDGSRLFVARHALGARGTAAWFGAATVDVLLTKSDTPLAPRPLGQETSAHKNGVVEAPVGGPSPMPLRSPSAIVQPRAMVARRSASTLLVASEGNDTLLELDALAVDPTMAVLRVFQVGSGYESNPRVARTGGAPQAIALSEDEKTAYVFCRSTYDIVTVQLAPPTSSEPGAPSPEWLHLAGDPLGARVSTGRKLFYNAIDEVTSGGLSCAGCHPEGRDDGFVWTEVQGPDIGRPIFVGGSHVAGPGVPRQTPMLSGRVAAKGPYGWHAQSDTLTARAIEGFHLHRWVDPLTSEAFGWEDAPSQTPEARTRKEKSRATALAAYLRQGLVPPPASQASSPEQARGKQLFYSNEVGCANCHAQREYTDRVAHSLTQLPSLMGFQDDPQPAFRTPSLLYVGGTPPYFHDGRDASLEDLIDHNDNRMGRTNQLSREDKAALVAFLRTL
jgi:cytochrome c peroxidase